MIMAHNHFKTLKLLVQALDHPNHDIYIHVDKKAGSFDPALISATCKHASISFIPRRCANWGGYSLVDITMSLLRTAVQKEHGYYHLLSGADMPLAPSNEIDAFFEAHQGFEFISFWVFRNSIQESTFLDRMRYYYYICDSFLTRWTFLEKVNIKNIVLHIKNPWSNTVRGLDTKLLLPLQKRLGVDRVKKSQLTFRKGSQWFSITHDFATYLLTQEKVIQEFAKYSSCPDECFVQTIAYNSEFRSRIYDLTPSQCSTKSSMREIDWSSPSSPNPRIFTSEDYQRLMDSGMLFARKFDESKDFDIIRRIYEHIT